MGFWGDFGVGAKIGYLVGKYIRPQNGALQMLVINYEVPD